MVGGMLLRSGGDSSIDTPDLVCGKRVEREMRKRKERSVVELKRKKKETSW